MNFIRKCKLTLRTAPELAGMKEPREMREIKEMIGKLTGDIKIEIIKSTQLRKQLQGIKNSLEDTKEQFKKQMEEAEEEITECTEINKRLEEKNI